MLAELGDACDEIRLLRRRRDCGAGRVDRRSLSPPVMTEGTAVLAADSPTNCDAAAAYSSRLRLLLRMPPHTNLGLNTGPLASPPPRRHRVSRAKDRSKAASSPPMVTRDSQSATDRFACNSNRRTSREKYGSSGSICLAKRAFTHSHNSMSY